MGQEKEQAKPPSIEEIRVAWNLFAENANAMAAYMMQNGALDMHEVGDIANCCVTLADFVGKAIQLNNQQKHAELEMRQTAERKLAADLAAKSNAIENAETPPAKVLSMKSTDNDPPKTKAPIAPKAASKKRGRTKPAAKKNSKKKK